MNTNISLILHHENINLQPVSISQDIVEQLYNEYQVPEDFHPVPRKKKEEEEEETAGVLQQDRTLQAASEQGKIVIIGAATPSRGLVILTLVDHC